MSILSVSNFSKSYMNGSVKVLENVDLNLEAGELVSVMGPSGSGKSTLLLGLGGLLQPDAGSVVVAGKDLYAMGPGERAAARADNVGFIFQRFHLIPYLSVSENIAVAAIDQNPVSKQARIQELMQRFGIQHRAMHKPGQLSVGEQQRVALARALFNKPALILADEPTGNLDRENGKEVLESFKAFCAEGGAMLMVTHDDRIAAEADRHLELRNQGIAEATAV